MSVLTMEAQCLEERGSFFKVTGKLLHVFVMGEICVALVRKPGGC